MALAEELKLLRDDMVDDNLLDTRKMNWEKVFTSCFLKVDDEVGGKINRDISTENGDSSSNTSEPVAPETVGSTAVVAVLCSSHIIVANCGDSRAVLYRGKEAVALSVDHKVRHSLKFHPYILFRSCSFWWEGESDGKPVYNVLVYFILSAK